MENADQTADSNEINALREGIKSKYQVYHTLDKERFPAIEYNTSRSNYEPLRLSFEEEFYVVRRINRLSNNLHIPSTYTLALIFNDDNYLPNKKILNTCRSYAEGKSQLVADEVTRGKHIREIKAGRVLWIVGPVLLIGLAIYIASNYLMPASTPNGLIITKPNHRQTVPRFLTIEGKVSNADTVWLVVHPIGWDRSYPAPVGWHKFYVQPPITVDENGIWKGQIYIGSADKGDIGVRSQIRAFVNLDKKYRVLGDYERYVFSSWPKAELSTQAIEVVRGPDNN
jgi:hypothetical protein